MTTREQQTIVAVFSTEEQARAAIRDLLSAGFSNDQIGFIHRNTNDEYVETTEEHTEDQAVTERGAAAGGVTGGVIGGLLGAAAALFIPGVGPVVAGGILGATLG
ncbi:MAG TPA: general stress protein, partial [Ktedonobacteraceae bacterium]|nr:general stress protein [Ktedonobacteraceae bacterium]